MTHDNKKAAHPLFKGHWSYVTGAVLLAVLNIILAVIYKPWGITGGIADWGIRLWAYLGGKPHLWEVYYLEAGYGALTKHPFFNEETALNIGLIAGVLLAIALASEFRLKLPKSGRQIIMALIGGALMGYGARLALGCNIGAVVGGIASQSLHGWIAGFFLFFGALAGTVVVSRLLVKIK